MSAHSTLISLPHSELNSLANKLNKYGFAADVDTPVLSPEIAEWWCEKCTKYIKKFGYTGGEISKINNVYSPKYGTVYAIFDSRKRRNAEKQIAKFK